MVVLKLSKVAAHLLEGNDFCPPSLYPPSTRHTVTVIQKRFFPACDWVS